MKTDGAALSRRTILLSALALTCMRRREPSGRLTARPRRSSFSLPHGLSSLGLGDRDAFLFVPSSTATKLMVMLHGAGGHGGRFVQRMQPFAESANAILLAPTSQRGTWDAIQRDFGPDVATIDRALEHVFARASVDPRHVAIGGFSDGASYALSLGLMNGDLFSHVIALSPGFVIAPSKRGKPKVFVSHGDEDEILPIERCGRPIAAELKAARYDVRYREFEGGHTVPPDVVTEAMEWFAR